MDDPEEVFISSKCLSANMHNLCLMTVISGIEPVGWGVAGIRMQIANLREEVVQVTPRKASKSLLLHMAPEITH